MYIYGWSIGLKAKWEDKLWGAQFLLCLNFTNSLLVVESSLLSDWIFQCSLFQFWSDFGLNCLGYNYAQQEVVILGLLTYTFLFLGLYHAHACKKSSEIWLTLFMTKQSGFRNLAVLHVFLLIP